MSRKMDYIPYISDYDILRDAMRHDLNYRKRTRINKDNKTSLGYPLYKNINIQVIMTQECPYKCSWCMERQNPMEEKARCREAYLGKIDKFHCVWCGAYSRKEHYPIYCYNCGERLLTN